MADVSSPGQRGEELGSNNNGGTGILQSTLSPKYLHTNSTSHTWPFSAIAELIDNAYDPDVKATQFWIDKLHLRSKTCLSFTDNGFGMDTQKLHKMLSFGFCEKVAEDGHMPVGHYGNGFKSGSMRLGKSALVLTKKKNSKSIGYLSQTYLETIKAETVVVPIATWDKKENDFILQPPGEQALKDIIKYSLLHSEEEIGEQFDSIPGTQGTRIIISEIRKAADNKHEFDFASDEYDIRIPDDASSDGGKYRQTKRQNHIPECDYSLKAYCAILYLKPRMQIILRGKKVKTQNVEKSLSQTEVDRYKPQVLAEPVKVVFGFNSLNKNHYGIMMYHRNRLIKPYERVGYQLKANNFGVGVVGVVQCDFLQPTHNKQDFDYTKAYRACMNALGVKLNEYWNEKKGQSRMVNNQASQPIPEPEETLPDQNWVQCDEPTCLKWRKLPDGIDPNCLPDKWYCYMNPDVNYKSCDVPEEKDEDLASITPYAKVQKKRLERELQEKNKREKELKELSLIEQQRKEQRLKEKEAVLKKKEDDLNKERAQLEERKPKVKIEGTKVPMAQVLPRPTTVSKPLHVVTPTTKHTPNRHVQSSPSTRSPAKASQPTPSLASQTHPRIIASKSIAPTTKVLIKQHVKKPVTSPQKVKFVGTSPSRNAETGQVSFKLVKSPDGNTFLVQDNSGRTKPSSSAAAQVLQVALNQVSNAITNANKPTFSPVAAAKNTKVDVKPKLSIVLPKPQTSVRPSSTSTSVRPSSSNANDRFCFIAPASLPTSKSSNTITVGHVKAANFPRIVNAISMAVAQKSTTQDNKKLITGVKREGGGSDTSPAKKPKKVDHDDVIVIDPLPAKSDAQVKADGLANRKIAQLEAQLKEKTNKLQVELDSTTAKLDKANKEVGAKTKELDEKTKQLEDRTKQLKDLRSNVCKLLQVLVPEIDVDCDEGKGEGETVDELLKQVLEANQ